MRKTLLWRQRLYPSDIHLVALVLFRAGLFLASRLHLWLKHSSDLQESSWTLRACVDVIFALYNLKNCCVVTSFCHTA